MGGKSQSLEIAFVGRLNLFSFLIMKHQKVDNLQRAKGCLAPSSRRWEFKTMKLASIW